MKASPAPLTVAAVATVVGVGTLVCSIAADSRWLAALGSYVVRHGVPSGVPYASAPTGGWHNVPVLSEVLLAGANGVLADRGFLMAQLLALAGCFGILAKTLRAQGATDASVAVVVLAVAVGAIPVLVVVRVQLFSLVFFPLLLALIYRDARTPDRRIWLIVPLVGLWSNLHGAVLAGVAVAGAYLLLARARKDSPLAVTVTVAMLISICATPALWQTPSYYVHVIGNESARQGIGLWAPLSPTVLDGLLVAATLGLCAAALRTRPQLWELVAIAALALLTLRTARSGVWLLFLLAAPASRGLRLETRVRARVGHVGVAIGVLLILGAMLRGPVPTGASNDLIRRAIREAHGTPILAEPIVAEQIALAGGRVWVSNPLDAFGRPDQRLYLAWIGGRPAGDEALRHAGPVVLVDRGGTPAARLARNPSYRVLARDRNASIYARRQRGSSG